MAYTDDDQSASTQRFQAFAQQQSQGRKDDLPAAWEMKASRNKVWLLVAIVIVVAVVAAVLGFLVAG